jgi:hypothetical protein
LVKKKTHHITGQQNLRDVRKAVLRGNHTCKSLQRDKRKLSSQLSNLPPQEIEKRQTKYKPKEEKNHKD